MNTCHPQSIFFFRPIRVSYLIREVTLAFLAVVQCFARIRMMYVPHNTKQWNSVLRSKECIPSTLPPSIRRVSQYYLYIVDRAVSHPVGIMMT